MDRMGALSFENALRLHEDSILLFRHQRFPSAYALSALSLEEIGKYWIIEDLVWHSRTDGRFTPEWEEKIVCLTYNHRHKQKQFAYHVDIPMFAKRAIRDIYDGKVEKKKQDAIYVGLPRRGKHVDLKARINNPSRLSERQTQTQITVVNDFLLCLAVGVVKGFYTVGIWALEEDVLTHDLIQRLRNLWPEMAPSASKDFQRMYAHPDPVDDE